MYQARTVLQKGQTIYAHTHKMTQCNNIQSTINHRTVFRQQFTQQLHECSRWCGMWTGFREKCLDFLLHQAQSALCSGRCLYWATLITLRKLCVFDTFWSFTMHMCTDTHTLTLILANCTNEARCHYISTTELKSVMVKSDMSRVMLKKNHYLPLFPPLSLPLPSLWTAKGQKDFYLLFGGESGI